MAIRHRPRRKQRTTQRQLLGRKRSRCPFKAAGVTSVDYKDVDMLAKYLSEDGKILSSRITGVCALMQRKLTIAIKRARYLALIPYTDQHSVSKGR